MADTDDSVAQVVPIRVVVVNLAAVVAQLVAQVIEQQPDMQVVARVQHTLPALLAVKQHAADVVVLGAAQLHPPPRLARRLLVEFPELKVVVLSSSGDAAMLYWLGIRRRQLGRVSARSLPLSIRQAALIDTAN